MNNIWQWIVEHWKTLGAILASTAGALVWFYKIRKARADAITSEIELQQAQHASSTLSSTEKRLLEALADNGLWPNNPSTGAGERLVRVGQLAQVLSMKEETVADSLERLERLNRVIRDSGTLDNPAPYWRIVPR
jgi:DNA-binding MarR family transcriptional regulator